MKTLKKKPAGNQLRKPPRSPRSTARRRQFLQVFKTLNLFGYIEIRSAVKAMPFIFFLAGWGLIFIANSYYTERTIREIDKVSRELKELKSEYITTKSDLMIKSGQSQVARAVAPMELEESRVAPERLHVPSDGNPQMESQP
jgi:hypothetical protein